ncbi:hypothetical protein K469DRAFT_694084 [Zopfia rhizophila CBS 207.26]|uniref:PARP catalytic domain-containing protein n=1 Tax=Zopfia rhizophila CBS 207.26 TaxID=1314779 RepID=A0A6A6DLT5_9PEZI|nr:hypothetical protein K469DRAFT_694084 [Zopfia rhizophila CBS 207.26]
MADLDGSVVDYLNIADDYFDVADDSSQIADGYSNIADDYDNSDCHHEKDEHEEIDLPNFIVSHESAARSVIDIIDANLPSELNYRGYVPNRTFKFGFDEFELSFNVDLQHSALPITCHVENYELSRKIIDGIRVALRQSLQSELNCEKDGLNVFKSGLIILRLFEEAIGHLQEYRAAKPTPIDKEKYWDLRSIKDIYSLLDSKLEMLGVDLDTVQGAATHILGKTPAQICQDILPGWRILHCENILRNDLQVKFLLRRQKLRETLMNQDIKQLQACVPHESRRTRGSDSAAKEQLVDYLLKPRITFHGTTRHNVSSIVQHCFLKPGDIHPVTKKPLGVDNGSVYGRGIYSSPDPGYALLYSGMEGKATKPSEIPGRKIIICATIMGRTAMLSWDDEWYGQSEPFPGADSHVNQSLLAYIVFHTAQILPCYVLHLDWADQTEDEVHDFIITTTGQLRNHSRAGTDHWAAEPLYPGDKQRLKEEKMAKAKKFFAYGFGPVSGKNIVIEEVGETDDDEEDYGDYQANRIYSDSMVTTTNAWEWSRKLEGETDFDEYTSARKAKVNKKNPAKVAT